MTKEEILSLGVPEENLRTFQEFYYRDLRKAVHREKCPAKNIRAAIAGMLPLIQSADDLRRILMLVTVIYSKPNTVEDSE